MRCNGQILREYPDRRSKSEIYAVVLPDAALKAALRVPQRVRAMLKIHVYTVSKNGRVRFVGEGADPTQLLP
jgi:hypothetical protein